MSSPQKAGLASLFAKGVAQIETHRWVCPLSTTGYRGLARFSRSSLEACRSDNLFEDLEKRSLTSNEERIIAERVALQRSLLKQFEERDKKRKVRTVFFWPEAKEI